MIDEKKLIEDFKNTFSDSVLNQTFGFGKYTFLEAIEEMINRQPQIVTDTNVGSKWIPCEERLPNTNGVYQVIREIKEGEMIYHIPTASYFDGQNTWHNDICVNFGRQNEQNVIAWQPIQPYKKEGAE